MLNKLGSFIRQQDLISAGDQVICAVSGGADSMALLFAMYLLKEKMSIRLAAAHFNHNLRGSESDADEAFVREFCDRYDIPVYVGSAAVVAGEKGLEAAAREARYGFFATLPGKIATAHTADDNAETVLMHLVRGTGLKGLGGIAPCRGNVIRPLLSVTRQEVCAFLQEYHIPHREDSSNQTDEFLRNRLRHHVMPLLRAENPSLAENLSATALRLRQDEIVLQECATLTEPLEVQWLRDQNPAIRSRILEQFLKKHGVREPEAAHIAQAEALAFSDNPSAFARFPGNVLIRRQYDHLIVAEEPAVLESVVLSCPCELEWGDYYIECRPAEQIIHTKEIFTICPQGNVTLRSRMAGDSIRLSGGTKPLKKLFIDRKIPAAQRSGIPVFADDGGVLAVYGLGTDEKRKAKKLPAWQLMITQKQK
jgi:tRNA(Ile)-lysidine synthase